MVSPRRQQSVAIPPNGRGSRILIVRLSSIGDVVHGLPLLSALRDALPEAHLAWIVEDWPLFSSRDTRPWTRSSPCHAAGLRIRGIVRRGFL